MFHRDRLSSGPYDPSVARKILPRDQAETAKKRAVSFLRNVLRDDDCADEVENAFTLNGVNAMQQLYIAVQ